MKIGCRLFFSILAPDNLISMNVGSSSTRAIGELILDAGVELEHVQVEDELPAARREVVGEAVSRKAVPP
jgi:hypothetical protein